ncbi:hypothetical protein M0R45_032067 [Rubus argutus]|uniref:Uncharacterized protein n=1 Tax=Rubus argutus TaxID=59490 RepID=A0AAW1WFG4_RUBAR
MARTHHHHFKHRQQPCLRRQVLLAPKFGHAHHTCSPSCSFHHLTFPPAIHETMAALILIISPANHSNNHTSHHHHHGSPSGLCRGAQKPPPQMLCTPYSLNSTSDHCELHQSCQTHSREPESHCVQ